MKETFRAPALRKRLQVMALVVVATTAATTAVVLPVATAQSSSPAPELVAGLPDFTRLVEKVGPGVVNVTAETDGRDNRQARNRQAPGQDQLPEIFRRFFGPGAPFPGGPDGQPQQPQSRGVSLGTGFIISSDGYVLTNAHVVDGADTVKVRLTDRREFTAKVVGSDKQSDVALLKIDASGLPALRLGDSSQLKPGQWAVAIGSPFNLDHSVTAGIISAVGRSNRFADQQYVPFIQTDVAINPGNSGGPLLNTRGEVVGINSQIFSNSGVYMGVSFAIPIDLAMNVVEQLKTSGKVSRGMIGVRLQAIDADTARGLGLPDTRGALINEVTKGSAGDKAGLKFGDVIRSVDGRQIVQSSELPPIIGAKPPGTKVELGILRDGKSRTVDVVLTTLDQGLLAGGQQDQNARPGPAVPAHKSNNPLGLVGESLDASDRKQLGLEPGEGVGIARIEGMAAREAGIRPGDVVVAVGRSSVDGPAALDRALAGVKPGQTVMLLINRGGNRQFVAVTPRQADKQ